MALGLDPTEEHEEVFNSSDLYDCRDYYVQTGDREPLDDAIILHQRKLNEARKELIFLIDLATQTENEFFVNRLTKLKHNLKQ